VCVCVCVCVCGSWVRDERTLLSSQVVIITTGLRWNIINNNRIMCYIAVQIDQIPQTAIGRGIIVVDVNMNTIHPVFVVYIVCIGTIIGTRVCYTCVCVWYQAIHWRMKGLYYNIILVMFVKMVTFLKM